MRRVAVLPRAAAATLLAAASLLPATARAGGLELPGNGTEALGRGGAFTAKADDATALEYNVAGLGAQRGTRTLLDLNIVVAQLTFWRSGTYPDDPANPATPWGKRPFPAVRNAEPPFPAPFFGLSTDFGRFRRWTFAVGAYGPSAAGSRTYPLGVAGYPSPARYDFAQSRSLVVYPTLAAAVRLWRWLDAGAALHVVVGSFDLTNVSFVDLSRSVCPNVEYQPCDSVNHLKTLGATATASLGLMARPSPWLALGASARLPFTVDSGGTVQASSPRVVAMPVQSSSARFVTSFPAVVRFGARVIALRDGQEAGDLEADATWEAWGAVPESQVKVAQLSVFQNITSTVVHHYHDTFSVRVGGAVNLRLASGTLTPRAGLFYDSSATDPAYTRVDTDTLDKIGVTAGLGYTVRGFAIQLAYAYVFELDRRVDGGAIRPTNGAGQGGSIASTGDPLPPVNGGVYRGNTQILSVGLSTVWDELVRRRRPAP